MLRRFPRSREQGFALLIVLWVLALIALVATRVLANGRVEARLAGNLRSAAEAEAAADGAVFDTAFRLLQAGPPYRATRAVQVLPLRGGGRANVAIEPEAGKINPNIAEPDLLAALFRACGADAATATALTAAVDAWRTPNAPNAAASYAAAGLDYAPPGAPFESLDELGLIAGMPPPLLACLLPRLSLFQPDDPDPAVADPIVLAALRDSSDSASVGNADDQYTAVTITATATLASGARFTRHAVIGIGPNASGAWDRVLAWDSPPP
jgi:general secretion pathway protein K